MIKTQEQYNSYLTSYIKNKTILEALKCDLNTLNTVDAGFSEISVKSMVNTLNIDIKREQNNVNTKMNILSTCKYNDRFIKHSKITPANDSMLKDLHTCDFVALMVVDILYDKDHVLNECEGLQNLSSTDLINNISVPYGVENDEYVYSGINYIVHNIIIDTTEPEYVSNPIGYLNNLGVFTFIPDEPKNKP